MGCDSSTAQHAIGLGSALCGDQSEHDADDGKAPNEGEQPAEENADPRMDSAASFRMPRPVFQAHNAENKTGQPQEKAKAWADLCLAADTVAGAPAA